MKLMNYLPVNLCGIPNVECGYYNKLKWCITVMVFYTIMVYVTRRYIALFSSGGMVRYGSYNRFVLHFVRDIIFCNMGWSITNFVIAYPKVTIIEGLIAVALLSVNFTAKSLFVFIKPKNIVIVLLVVLEMICAFSDKTLVFFSWSMFNKSDYFNGEVFSIFEVVMVQLVVIAIFISRLCYKKLVKGCNYGVQKYRKKTMDSR